jgi:plastocyanin
VSIHASGPLPQFMAAALLCGAVAAATPHSGAIYTVTIENMAYSPARLTVHRGDRIKWLNKDLFPHTVSASGGAFDSGSIDAGASWTYTATKSGEHSYGCKFHPTMKGELKVE